jgi:hypothetical protein
VARTGLAEAPQHLTAQSFHPLPEIRILFEPDLEVFAVALQCVATAMYLATHRAGFARYDRVPEVPVMTVTATTDVDVVVTMP